MGFALSGVLEWLDGADYGLVECVYSLWMDILLHTLWRSIGVVNFL